MRGFPAVLKKEALQMLRDRGTLQFALLVPAFQLALFGLIDTNVRRVPTVVFDQSRTAESRRLIEDFVHTSYFEVIAHAPSRSQMRERIVAGAASVGIEIPPDYARRRIAGLPADVLVLIDGSDSSISSQALAAANGVALARSLAELAGDSLENVPIRLHP
ncbi:MAG TPA: ABC transporter permease, partial [Thermoanaerobaculia bacterium]